MAAKAADHSIGWHNDYLGMGGKLTPSFLAATHEALEPRAAADSGGTRIFGHNDLAQAARKIMELADLPWHRKRRCGSTSVYTPMTRHFRTLPKAVFPDLNHLFRRAETMPDDRRRA